MDRQAAIERLLELYDNPTHFGPLEGADISVKGGNPGCGDIVDIHIKVDDQGKVERIMFQGEGCTISQAAASIVTEKVIGKTLQEVAGLGHELVVEDMGREVVANRLRCATLALNTLKAAERKYHAGLAATSADQAPTESF